MPCRNENPRGVEVGELGEIRPDVAWSPPQDGPVLALSVEDSPGTAVVHVSPERRHDPSVAGDRKRHRCELRDLPQERHKAVVVNLRRKGNKIHRCVRLVYGISWKCWGEQLNVGSVLNSQSKLALVSKSPHNQCLHFLRSKQMWLLIWTMTAAEKTWFLLPQAPASSSSHEEERLQFLNLPEGKYNMTLLPLREMNGCVVSNIKSEYLL